MSEAPFPLRRVLLVLVFVPAIWLGLLIYSYGVDAPYWDEWDEIPSGLLKLHAGTLSFSDLIAQHNEHRIFFPRILMLATAWLTSWNVRAELFVIWLLACVCSFSIWRLSRITGNADSNLNLALLASANVLLFTPMAFWNWLWGFQIGFLLPVAVVTMTIWLVSASGRCLAFIFAFLLSFVCTFSIASGFLCWLVTLPLLVFPAGSLQWRDRIPGLLCWLIGFLGSGLLYVHGYVKPTDHPGVFLIAQAPGTAALYLLYYLGSPFGWSWGFKAVAIFGGCLAALFSGTLVYLWRYMHDTRLLAQTLPWLMLSMYALLNGAITMVGRLGFGPDQATAPRYITFSVMFPIGLIFMGSFIYSHFRGRASTAGQVQAFRGFLLGCLVLGLGSNIICSFLVLNQWELWKRARLTSKVLVEFSEVTNEESLINGAHFTYGSYTKLREDVGKLAELGYLRPAPVKSAAIAALADVTAQPTNANGRFDRIARGPDGQTYAYGWAVLADEECPADAVILTYEDKAHPGDATIFGIAPIGFTREDVVKSTGEENFRMAGWIKPLTPGMVPPGPHVLRAWAFSLEDNRAYRLAGEAEWNDADVAPRNEAPR